MTDDIVIWDINHHEVSELLVLLAQQGLEANRDFEFGFHPAFVNRERGLADRRSAMFRFRDPIWATWFQLKYATYLE